MAFIKVMRHLCPLELNNILLEHAPRTRDLQGLLDSTTEIRASSGVWCTADAESESEWLYAVYYITKIYGMYSLNPKHTHRQN